MGLPKILFTIGGLHPEFGGPSQSVPTLCSALVAAGAEVEIVALHYGRDWQAPEPVNGVPVTFVDCGQPLGQKLQWSPRFRSTLKGRCQAMGAQVIHDTGMWLLNNHAAAVVSGELKLPRIVSPRGMLTGWALQHKGMKKRLAWGLYQRRDLESAQAFHATSRAEVEDIRAAGFRQPVALIPNGVVIPETKDARDRQNAGTKTLLFLGRIHPVKGLLDLVGAWAAIQPDGWRVVIAGSDDGGHRAEVEAAVRTAGLDGYFTFTGPISGKAKWDLYQEADLFVLPSHSENFGMVVAEALASGVPVIATKATPWDELPTRRCGWWVATGKQALAEALREACARTVDERREMGVRGRRWMEQDYSWQRVALQMRSVYASMVGQGERPAYLLT